MVWRSFQRIAGRADQGGGPRAPAAAGTPPTRPPAAPGPGRGAGDAAVDRGEGGDPAGGEARGARGARPARGGRGGGSPRLRRERGGGAIAAIPVGWPAGLAAD